jgi:protease I
MKDFLPILGMIIGVAIFIIVVGLLSKGSLIGPGEKGGVMEGTKILMVVAPENFRDEEYQKPREILEQAGAEITVASKGVTEAKSLQGGKVKVDKDIGQVNVDDYQALVFVGGPGSSVYFEDQTALNLAKSAFEKGKVVSAICIAPSILANAGILSGKKATAYSSEKDNLVAKGAQFTGESVTADGKIVTANGPEAAEEFGKKLVEVFKE